MRSSKKAALPEHERFVYLAAAASQVSSTRLGTHLGRLAVQAADVPSAGVSKRAAMQLCSRCGTFLSSHTCSGVHVVPLSKRTKRRAAAAAASNPGAPNNVVAVVRTCKVCGHGNVQPFASPSAAQATADRESAAISAALQQQHQEQQGQEGQQPQEREQGEQQEQQGRDHNKGQDQCTEGQQSQGQQSQQQQQQLEQCQQQDQEQPAPPLHLSPVPAPLSTSKPAQPPQSTSPQATQATAPPPEHTQAPPAAAKKMDEPAETTTHSLTAAEVAEQLRARVEELAAAEMREPLAAQSMTAAEVAEQISVRVEAAKVEMTAVLNMTAAEIAEQISVRVEDLAAAELRESAAAVSLPIAATDEEAEQEEPATAQVEATVHNESAAQVEVHNESQVEVHNESTAQVEATVHNESATAQVEATVHNESAAVQNESAACAPMPGLEETGEPAGKDTNELLHEEALAPTHSIPSPQASQQPLSPSSESPMLSDSPDRSPTAESVRAEEVDSDAGPLLAEQQTQQQQTQQEEDEYMHSSDQHDEDIVYSSEGEQQPEITEDGCVLLGELYASGMAELRAHFTPGRIAYSHHPWWVKKGLRMGACMCTRERLFRAQRKREREEMRELGKKGSLKRRKMK